MSNEKNMLGSFCHRFSALLLCMLVLFGSLTAAKATEPNTFEAAFPATSGGARTVVETTMDDAWFGLSSAEYQHNLAKLSISMAVSAFRDNKATDDTRDHYLREFMEHAGFEGYRSYGYDQPTGDTTVSNGIAMRRMTDEKGGYVLLAVPVCGQGYGNEWLGNFTVGDTVEHSGFANAADQVYARVLNYIRENCPESRVKVWATGFSRAAAVSNLLGDRLLRDDRFEQDEIFIYTFGTPATTMQPTAWPQIFNICRSFDPVPKVPLTEWGYWRHGTTLYLPARETDPDYDESAAAAVYRKIRGLNDFGEDVALNFLLSTILDLLSQNIPKATDYVGAYQQAIIAAWNKKGSILDKVEAMRAVLERSDIDTSNLQTVTTQIVELVSLGVNDTMNLMLGNGGSQKWFDLLSSGMAIAREHFPEGYMAWLYSTDDPEKLFSQGNLYRMLAWTGKMDAVITLKNPQTGSETVVFDTKNKLNTLAAVQLQGRTCVALPAICDYHVQISARSETLTQIGYSVRATSNASIPLLSTNAITLYAGEGISIELPATDDPDALVQVLLDGGEELMLHGTSGKATPLLSLQTSEKALSGVQQIITSAVVMIPWLLSAVLLVVFAAFVAVKRLIRHHVQDHVLSRVGGRIVLIVTALVAFALAGIYIYQLIARVSTMFGASMTNRTMQRVAEFLGWGLSAYRASMVVVYAMLGVLCLRSCNHRLSRIRCMRHAAMIMVLNCLTMFMTLTIGRLSPLDVVIMLVPLAAILGVALAHAPQPEELAHGKHIIRVLRIASLTVFLFLLRQLLLLYVVEATNVVSVVLKTLAGLPVVVLTIDLYDKAPTYRRKYTMLAILLYFAANAVINLSVAVGTVVFAAGHGVLIYCSLKLRKPQKRQIVLWVVLSALMVVEFFFARSSLEGFMKILAIPYGMVIAALVVLSLRMPRRVRFSALMMIAANQLLVLVWMYPGNFVMESVELLCYYLSIIALGCDLTPARKDADPNGSAQIPQAPAQA